MGKNGEIVFFANYYSAECKGFYFKTADELEERAKKLAERGCEEYEIEFIDGPSGTEKLWSVVRKIAGDNTSALEVFFDDIVDMSEHDRAALVWVIESHGERDLEEAIEKVKDEVRLFQGTVKDYAYELIDEIGIEGINSPEAYFDYEAFGRDAKMVLDADNEDDAWAFELDDEEYGERLVDDLGWKGIGKDTRATYFDYDAFARALARSGDVDTIEFAGSEWVVTNPHL